MCKIASDNSYSLKSLVSGGCYDTPCIFKNADMELNVNIQSLQLVLTDYLSRKIATTTTSFRG